MTVIGLVRAAPRTSPGEGVSIDIVALAKSPPFDGLIPATALTGWRWGSTGNTGASIIVYPREAAGRRADRLRSAARWPGLHPGV